MKRFDARGTWPLIAAVCLSACGGGGDSSNGTVPLPAAQAPSPAVSSGKAQIHAVTISYRSEEELNAVIKLLDHVHVDPATDSVSAEVDTRQLNQLDAMGLPVRVNEAETARIRHYLANFAAATGEGLQEKISDGANGVHGCYRTVEKVYDSFDALAAKYPKLAKVQPLGKTWMGTQYRAPGTGDDKSSSFAKLLRKYLPASALRVFNLDLLPVEPAQIKAIVVGNFEKQDAQANKPPNLVMTGGIHAREYAPQEVGIRYIEWLLDNYETDANARMMVDNNRFHYIVHNPDGRKLAEQDPVARQRKNINYEGAACKTNPLASGVDLNRNYPFGWTRDGQGADSDVCEDGYRGPSAASEPETQVVLQYLRGKWNQSACRWEGGALPDGRPKSSAYCNAENRDNGGTGELDWKTGAADDYAGGVYLDLHSYSRAILWPWGVARDENDNNIQTMNNKGMATIAQRMAYHSKYSAQQVLGYSTEGTTKDAVYGFLGAPAFTVEMGRSFYDDCGAFTKEIYSENFAGLHYVSRILHRPYQLPLGPDTVDVKIAAAPVQAGTQVALKATVDDNRYLHGKHNQSTFKQPPEPVIRNIRSAMAYIDKLPWETDAIGIPLKLSAPAKVDRKFPMATRVAGGSLDTTGLTPGRHMVYVQGTNEDGKTGSVSAAFLDIK